MESFHCGVLSTVEALWSCRCLLFDVTSIPPNSDPDLDAIDEVVHMVKTLEESWTSWLCAGFDELVGVRGTVRVSVTVTRCI